MEEALRATKVELTEAQELLEARELELGELRTQGNSEEALQALQAEKDQLMTALQEAQTALQTQTTQGNSSKELKELQDELANAIRDMSSLRKDNEEYMVENSSLQAALNDLRNGRQQEEMQRRFQEQSAQFGKEIQTLAAERDALVKKVSLLVEAAKKEGTGDSTVPAGGAVQQSRPAVDEDSSRDELRRTLGQVQRCIMELEHGKEKVRMSKNRLKQVEKVLPQLGKIWQQVNDGVKNLERSRSGDPVATHLGHVLADLRDALRSTRTLLDTVQSTSDSQEVLITSLYETLTQK